MNGKKAKILRRQAEALSVGYLDVGYMPYKPVSYYHDPTTGKKMRTIGIPLRMIHTCTRNIYKLLKAKK